MKFNVPKQAQEIIDILEKAGFEIYIVGGVVHDLLIGKLAYDWDFTTNATPEEILKLFENKEAYYKNEFGMVGIPNNEDGERPYEITTYRTEHGYEDFRRPKKVKWGKSLKEDLQRRDFTINAMAFKRVKGTEYKLIDHYNGRKDLDNKLIRAVGNPNERFKEDALRMMRAVRIAAELNFKVEKETKAAIKSNAQLIHKIAAERIRDELMKLLASPHPYEGMVQFREVGLMQQILPELEKCFGVEQKSPGRHHIYDVGTHSMLALKECKNQDPIVRFATLIHDIGKPQTVKKLENGTITFYNHEIVGARIVKKISKRLRLSNKDADKLWILVRYHQFTVNENQTDKAIRRFIKNVGVENVEDMLDLRTADRLGGGAAETSWRTEEFKKRLIEVQKQPFTVHDLKVDGTDVMRELKIKPGPKVGEILNQLFVDVVEKKVPNEKETLIEKLKDYK